MGNQEQRTNADYLELRRHVAEYLKRLAGTVRAGDYLLEIGVGPRGSVIEPHLPIGVRYVGCDREDVSSSLPPGHGPVVVWDCEDASPPPPEIRDFRFDFVLLSEVLEHARDPWRVVEVAKGVLAQSGRLVITVPFSFRIHMPADYWRFTQDGLLLMMQKAGLRVTSCEMKWLGWQDVREPLNIFVEAMLP